MKELLEVSCENRVAVISLNRPPANALNLDLAEELHEAIKSMSRQKDVGAVIITSSLRIFAAGADIKMMQRFHRAQDQIAMQAFTRKLQWLYDEIEQLPKPTIAMVNGPAMGGGFELALSCDFRFMSTNAILGLPEIKLGLLPGAGGTQRLTRCLGKSRTLRLILEGQEITAPEALALGLVNDIYEPEDIWKATLAFAERIASRAPLAVSAIKRCVNAWGMIGIQEGFELEIAGLGQLFASRDAGEGLAAFLEKREPQFIGE